MTNILEIKNLQKKFNTINGEIEAIKDISFNLHNKEFIAIVGSSGCGKSTLLSIISNLESKTNGEINFTINNPTIGYMLQEDALFDHLTIKDNITLGLKIMKKDTKENIAYANELLKKYNLDKYKDKYPKELSGGMKQRAALIRTLAIKPDILLLDEPFSALDYTTRLSVADDVYKIIKETNISTIIVTHDLNEAVALADKVIVLSKSPATIKNIYDIKLDNKSTPTLNRKDTKFNYYYDLIMKDLDIIV